MWLSDLCIRRPVLACMMISSLMLLGLISASRVGIDLFPRVEFPYVSVETLLNGASPITMETEVTDTLEEEVVSTSGIENMRSVSSEGYSQLFVEFDLDENVEPGDTVEFTLTVSGGDKHSFEAEVRAAGDER